MKPLALLLLLAMFGGTAYAADREVVSAETEHATEVQPAAELSEEDFQADDVRGDAAVETEATTSDAEAAADAADAKRLVYIYEDGCAVGYKLDEEWEFYEVERKDIRQGNADLMREVSAHGSEGEMMLGAAVRSGNDAPQLAVTGPAPGGPVAAGQWRRRTNGKGDWQELYFDFGDSDSYSVDYDRSTMRGNWDVSSFTRNGNVWALKSDDDSSATSADAHEYITGTRDRTLTEASYRNGSAEGGNWRANLRHYDTEIGASVSPQPDDSRLTRFELGGRLAKSNTVIDAGAFAGSYRSNRAQLDNDFSGVRLDGSHWLSDCVELKADGSLTRIDAGVQNASATRSDYSAELGWDMTCDTRLSAFTRGHRDDSDISAGTSIRGWRDTGAKLEYRPDGDTALSATLTQRDIDTEHLAIDDSSILPFLRKFDPVPTREDLAGLRHDEKAGGKLLDIAARHRFNEHFYMGANASRQDFTDLPEVHTLLSDDQNPPYFADHRQQASLHAAYDLCDLGNVTFRADRDHRGNSERGSSLKRDQYTLGYSAPLCKAARLGLGVTRQTTVIETTSNDDDVDGSGWNYSLNLAGASHCTNYVLSANRARSKEHGGGDLSSLGLELDFDSPWRVSAWWRQFDDLLGGSNANDLGMQVGYRIDL